jgi:hypothetical protein
MTLVRLLDLKVFRVLLVQQVLKERLVQLVLRVTKVFKVKQD